MLSLLLAALLAASTPAAEADLSPFFGYFRVKAYNGVVNEYSNRFFMPSIHVEPSNRLRREGAPPLKVLKFNFEVPLKQEDESIHLKHLFVEVPLDGAEVEAKADSASILFEGELQELINGKWETCSLKVKADLKRWNEEIYSAEITKEASLPCPNATHQYLIQRVKL